MKKSLDLEAIKMEKFNSHLAGVEDKYKPFVVKVENCDFDDANVMFNAFSTKEQRAALGACFYGDLFPYVFVSSLIRDNDNISNRLLAMHTAILAMQANKENYHIVEEQMEAIKKRDPENAELMRATVTVYEFQQNNMKGIPLFTRQELNDAATAVLLERPDDMTANKIKEELAELDIIDKLKVNKDAKPISPKYLNRRF